MLHPLHSLPPREPWYEPMRAVTPLLSSLQALPPLKYPSLLQQSLETDIFPEVISILHEDYVRYVGAVYLYTEFIHYIAAV